jgi:hypothetical protein
MVDRLRGNEMNKHTTIVVGNGTSLLEAEAGAAIDAFGEVVRFNHCPIAGYEKHVGRRTDVWFTVMKHAPGRVARLRPLGKVYAHSWEPDAKKCQTYQSYVGKGLDVEKVDHALVGEINAWMAEAGEDAETRRGGDGETGYRYWSTGALAVWLLLKTRDRVTITGFDWWERPATEHHYGDKAARGTLHRPEVERVFFDRLIAEGRVEVLPVVKVPVKKRTADNGEGGDGRKAKVEAWSNGVSRAGRKLTIGMLVYDDFDGVYFTVQSLRLHHPEVMGECEFLILDNHPESKHGEAVRVLSRWLVDVPVRYVPVQDRTGTALRDRVFALAETPYVLCVDAHVLLEGGALAKLVAFLDWGTDEGGLCHGPMLYDNLQDVATHMEMEWRAGMWGTWASDARGKDREAAPFEIPAHGMGLFACRKEAWLGFPESFRGFGGEECYIHEKYRQAGRKVWCLPFLRWLHRFPRPWGVPYPIQWEDRIHNYLVGYRELGRDEAEVLAHFREMGLGEAVRRVVATGEAGNG